MRDHVSKRQRRRGPAGLFAALFFLPACTSTTPQPAKSDGDANDPAKPPTLDLWAGVPPIEPEAGDIAAELTPTPGPKPPPSISETVELPFPPPEPPSKQTQDRPDEGPLKVLRTTPTEKEPGLIGSVTAVFNQPMIPLASIDDLKLERSPMSIEPQPKGKFRWLGTQMIAFEPEGRMPFSTTYTARVAAGETSTLGTKMAKEVKWQFTTPALAVESHSPADWDSAELDTLIVIRFNQAIDRDKLVKALHVRGGGGEVAVTAVAPDAWATLAEPWRSIAQQGPQERVLVLRPNATLTADTAYSVEIPAGVYGEGPNPSKAIRVQFRTYPPLRLSGPNCTVQYPWDCSPTGGIQIHASNPIVADPSYDKKVRITPEVPELNVTVSGGIHLTGKFRGLGTYTIEVDAGLRDVHGQELKAPYRKTVTLPALDAGLQWTDRQVDPAVLEPSHSGVLEARATGLTSVEVRARSFEPGELRKVLGDRYVRYDGEWPGALADAPWDKKFDVRDSKVEAALLPFDTRAMGAGPGKFVVLAARSNQLGDGGWRYRQSLSQVVQITRLGVTAALDSDSGVVFVTDLDSGQPLAGVDVALHNTALDGPTWSGKTGPDGLVELTHGTMYDNPYLLARYQDEAAYVPLQQTADGSWGSWSYAGRDDEPRIFFYTDRQPYKPGETVHLQGVVREETRGPAGKVQMWRAGTTATYTVNGPRGHEVAKGELKIGPFGTFSVDIPIPADGDTGTYSIHLVSPGGLFSSERSFHHGIEVQQFRAPEFEVKVERPAAAALMFGDTLNAEIKANYLHGAPMVGAEATYTLRRVDSPYRPPGGENESFTFGKGSSFLWGYDDWSPRIGKFGAPQIGGGMLVRQGSGPTDARGVLTVSHLLAATETPWGQKTPAPAPEQKKSDDPPGAATYTLEANVTDENRQAIAGRSTYVVHPASEYAGVRADRSVYRAGERARLEAVVVDVDGKRITGREIALRLVRKETSRAAVEENGSWRYKYETVDVEVGTCALTSSQAPVNCDLVVDKAGSYDVRALVSDPQGRKALSIHPFYVYGEDAVVWQQDQHRVDMVPDKRSYEPGETATVLVRSPFDRARGLVVIAREGIVSHRAITVEGGAATLDIPLDEAQIPGVRASIILVRGRVDVPGAPPGQDLGRPAFAVGEIELKIAPTRKKIALEVLPETTEVAPKDTLRLTLKARDAGGAPQRAAVAVMVVDEAVLSLMGFQTPDPLAFFHHDRDPGVSLYDLRQYLVARKQETPAPIVPEESDKQLMSGDDAVGFGGLGLVGSGIGGGGTGTGYGYGAGAGAKADRAEAMPVEEAPAASMPTQAPMAEKKAAPKPAAPPARMAKGMAGPIDANMAMNQPISLRSLFATTAYFNAEVDIDAGGEAKLEIPMPENLTSFRIMAVAVDPERADRFGSGEAAVKVRKPIMLRPSLPRFANFGDKFEASVMVDNQTADPQAILVGTRGANVVITGDATKGVEIPAGESREVRFPMAVDRVGTMRLQFAALSNGGRDATELALPVHYPATRQAFADYGVTADSILRTLKVPEDALPAFGGLEVSMSSTALTGLEDAVDFLIGYRYECTEQLASRLLPIFVLGPVLEQFPIASVRDLEQRQALGAEGIARIQSRQNYDGGFRYWDTPARSSPYLTAWVTFAWLEGKKAGFKVDESALDRAMNYLDNFVRYGEATPWGRYYDHTSRAFALWLMSRDGKGADLFERVYAKRKEMPLYAHALLMSTAHRHGLTSQRDALVREFRAKVVETAKTAHFAESAREADAYGLQVLMHSNVQTDAIALMALLEIVPDDPLLPKVMAGIMDNRDPQKGGQWGTTHANAWALLAASRYFTAVEKEVPDYVARIWLDSTFAGERAFKGRSMAVVEQQIPMAKLVQQKPRELLLSKDGPGLLYYRLGFRYAPADLAMKAESQGFTVYRTYEPLAQGGDAPDPNSVRRLDDGTWEIKAGALVRVNLTLVAKDRANFVVVDDPLPAGLEGQNAKFLTTLRDVQGGVESQSVDRGGLNYLDDVGGWWWWRPWWRFDHTEMRDDRMLLFADHLPAGVYTYSYTARATTIGEFSLPPVRAEAMYMPELFGHGAASKVRIVE